jgi:hypothetical protein
MKNGRFKRAALIKAVVHKIRGEAWGDWGAWEQGGQLRKERIGAFISQQSLAKFVD